MILEVPSYGPVSRVISSKVMDVSHLELPTQRPSNHRGLRANNSLMKAETLALTCYFEVTIFFRLH